MFQARRILSQLSNRRNLQVLNYLSKSQSSTVSSPITLSETCIKRLKELDKQDSKQHLRVIVESGGCSGLNYKFSLDTNITDEDE